MAELENRDLWLCRNTLIEMMEDRGYTTAQKALTYESFLEKFPVAESKRATLNFVAQKGDAPLAINFVEEEKMGKKMLETIMDKYEKENIFHLILVQANNPSPAAVAITNITTKFKIELFLAEELRFNRTKHVWVPPHRILSEEEKQELLNKLRVTPDKLPKILKTDTVARYLGANTNDVLEIQRPSRTAGTSLYYRIVIERQK